MRAAKAGDAPAIRLLLAHHALPDLGNNLDITPLMAAAGVGTGDPQQRDASGTSFRFNDGALAITEASYAVNQDKDAAGGVGGGAAIGAADG